MSFSDDCDPEFNIRPTTQKSLAGTTNPVPHSSSLVLFNAEDEGASNHGLQALSEDSFTELSIFYTDLPHISGESLANLLVENLEHIKSEDKYDELVSRQQKVLNSLANMPERKIGENHSRALTLLGPPDVDAGLHLLETQLRISWVGIGKLMSVESSHFVSSTISVE